MNSYEIRVMRLNESPDAPKLEAPETACHYWESVVTKMVSMSGQRSRTS